MESTTVKKKKVQREEKNHPNDELLETLLKAIAEKIQSRSSPGIVLSWIRNKQIFYGSVVTYSGNFGEGKTVVFSRTATTAAGVIMELANELVKESEMDKLKDLV